MERELTHEINMLRSFAVSIVGRDSEGVDRPEFVRKIMRATKLTPTQRYTGGKAFLDELAKND